MIATPDLNMLAASIFQQNLKAGWWDGFKKRSDRFETCMALIITEFAKAIEGDRKDLMDTHLPNRKMLHVEIADVAIRALDFAGALNDETGKMIFFDGWNVFSAKKLVKGELKGRSTPERLRACVKPCVTGPVLAVPSMIISRCIALAELYDFNLWEIIDEKREYNRKRADHKMMNRKKKGGKKY